MMISDWLRNTQIIYEMLSSSAVDRGFESRRVTPKTKKSIFVASPLSTQH